MNLWNWMKYSKCKHKINLHGSIKYFYIVLFLGKQRNSILLNIYLRIILEKVFTFYGWTFLDFVPTVHCLLGGLVGLTGKWTKRRLHWAQSTVEATVTATATSTSTYFWYSRLAAASKTWLGQMLTALPTSNAAEMVAATHRRRRHRCSWRGCAALFVFMTANWSAPHTNSTGCTHEAHMETQAY